MGETKITIRRYGSSDVRSMRKIWNEVVSDGVAFPQEELLTDAGAATFFVQQPRAPHRRATGTGLHSGGQSAGVPDSAIQRGGRKQHARAAFVRAHRIPSAGHDSGRIPDE